MTKDEALPILLDVIENDKHHQDYDRVIGLADEYYKMKSGDNITDLLKRMITRETEEEFDQRKKISKSVIPSTLNSTQLPFQKALRKQPLLREIITKSKAKKTELEDHISHYWGEKSLEEYLEYAFINYNYIDPNAFLITEFDEFDSRKEKAAPYPFVATSKECIMFEYKNQILQYLIVQLPIQYKDYEEIKKQGGIIERIDITKDGSKFTMYLGQDTVQMTQVGKDGYMIDLKEGQKIIVIKDNYYLLEYFEPKANKVPAARFGYLYDTQTKGRTMVSVFHPVLLLLEKMMKTDSEEDLSIAMTAFPQRLIYLDKCHNPQCKNGQLLDGSGICQECQGTGKSPIHKGVTDILTFKIPDNPADMIDLEQLLVYKSPPIETLKFMDEYVSNIRKLIHAMMFNAEIFSRTEITTTATEKELETDNMNDTLYPFARAFSQMWEFIVEDIATFTDLNDGLMLHHKMPEDFKFKSLPSLMAEMKAAKDAGASTSTIAAIEDDINNILYADRPGDLKRIQVKQKYNPFRGYDESTVRLLISQSKTTEYNAVLWANLESVFNEIELETPDIYNKSDDIITEKVKTIVTRYIEEINNVKEIKEPFKG